MLSPGFFGPAEYSSVKMKEEIILKKIIALLLAALMCMGLLAACGGNNGNGGSDNGSDSGSAVTGETFDAGNVSCIVPDGWKAFPQNDLFSDEEGATDPDVINVCKGASTELDMFSKPYIRINYYAPSTYMTEPSKDFYDDVADLDDMTIGDYTWHGFSCTSIGYKYYMLWTGAEDEAQYQVSVLYENGGSTISLDDADVQAIIASIKGKAE